MMKKVLCSILTLVLLCFAFTSCGETDVDKSNQYLEDHTLTETTPKYTLSFCLVTDTALSSAALAAMQTAFNAYVELAYSVHVSFINVTLADYEEFLDEKFASVEAAIESGNEIIAPSSDAYPGLKNTQFDILLVTSYNMMNDLIENERVLDLTTYLASSKYRNIKNYMTESFLTTSMIDGKNYAIPNCRVMGEYTYLIVDKTLAAKNAYTLASEFTDWESTAALRESLTRDNDYDFSGTHDPYDVNAPVRLVTGQYSDRHTYEENGYFCYEEEMPSVYNRDLFTSMFAVSAYTVSADSAMQILYAINTNKTLRTILQYGILGTNYTLDNGVVTLVTDPAIPYSVNSDYLGNIFSLYPCVTNGETEAMMAEWQSQNNHIIFTYQVNAIAGEGGSVSTGINGKYTAGSTVTLTATANEGYTFTGWFVEGSLEAVSTDASYSYKVPASDTSFTAQFAVSEENP